MVEFDKKEIEVLHEYQYLLDKKRLSEKIIRKLAQVEVTLKHVIQTAHFPFPGGTKVKSGKISKGENYKDLPYFVLDYPRLFSRKAVFSFRVMIRWGHEISCILHMSGKTCDPLRAALNQNLQDLEEAYLCVHDSPWEYHFAPDNYKLLSELSLVEIENYIIQHPFAKIAWKFPLSDIGLLEDKAASVLQTALHATFPDSQKSR